MLDFKNLRFIAQCEYHIMKEDRRKVENLHSFLYNGETGYEKVLFDAHQINMHN